MATTYFRDGAHQSCRGGPIGLHYECVDREGREYLVWTKTRSRQRKKQAVREYLSAKAMQSLAKAFIDGLRDQRAAA